MIKSGEGPRQSPPRETARKVRVIAVPAVALVPRALGYGSVKPEMVWEAVAEVGTLDSHIALAPERHVWWEEKVPWLDFDDDLPRYARFSRGNAKPIT